MAFRFKFDVLLRYRKRLEDEARRAYMLARRELEDSLSRLNQLYESVDQTREHIGELERSGHPEDLESVRQGLAFISGQGIRIDQERMRARELMSVAEEKQELLAEAAKERKILDKLKEKMAAEYRKFARREEMKAVDDLVVMRAGRGKAI